MGFWRKLKANMELLQPVKHSPSSSLLDEAVRKNHASVPSVPVDQPHGRPPAGQRFSGFSEPSLETIQRPHEPRVPQSISFKLEQTEDQLHEQWKRQQGSRSSIYK